MSDAVLSMARPITLLQPSRLEIGAGAIARLGAWAAGYRRIFVVAMPPTVGFVERIGLSGEVATYIDIPPEPDLPAVEAVLAAARAFRPDLVIGLGGGSVMDVAKLVAALWDSEQAVLDVVGVDKLAGRRSALAQVPTTSGTGSEAGIRSLVTNPATLAKLAVESRHMLADIAVLDPELTYSVPAAVTAATGIDALAHCVEAFTNLKAHPLIDGYARLGIELVGRYLPRAVADGADTEARAGMMLASYYGGLCLGPVNTAGGHALAYPLGTRLKLPHGLANAIVFPHVLAFNTTARPDKTTEIVTALGLGQLADAREVLAGSMAYCRDLGIEMSLARHGAQEAELPVWAEEAFAIKRLIDNNPRALGVSDILTIYTSAL
ncbi:alcohol dehydrogenase [Devosia sp. Root413D1]|uniref:iron-containing alcohol dehydrogenase n=1 Tax=unclassified Devosia TaxID=196773 RepID=UPI0006F71FB7|nr:MULTISPECIES: iron-containing alcohol dehydrogenase [unclassified Devosia]KQU95291.1 alcohol dehydrogenase [Devosia sp. Root105]KQW83491.1 alcohol dehydrogenase [Devosia sp. Root413D1]